MTIDKAIEILNESAHGRTTFNEDFKDAELLAIEALRTCKWLGENIGENPGEDAKF
jgi:hypothetical protein